MKKNEIFAKFTEMFPMLSVKTESFKKIGGRAIKLFLNDESTLCFMYYDENNWNLGTKMWRRKPVENANKLYLVADKQMDTKKIFERSKSVSHRDIFSDYEEARKVKNELNKDGANYMIVSFVLDDFIF